MIPIAGSVFRKRKTSLGNQDPLRIRCASTWKARISLQWCGMDIEGTPCSPKLSPTSSSTPLRPAQWGSVFHECWGDLVVLILGSLSKGRRVTEIAIDQAHRIVGHKAARKTRDYLACWYWWPNMAKDVEAFCKSCGICQTTKTSTSKPKGLLRTLPIPTAPWLSITMDFVGPFPKVHGYDYLLVVICRLTSLVHLIPTVTTASATDIAWAYLKEVVRLHGLPDTIVSDRDSKFISKF
jgi:hypothetical protein